MAKLISAKHIANKVVNKEDLFILDVRNQDEFKDWKIEGESVEIINEPYFNLIDGVDSILDQIPENKPVVTVCAKGGSSEFVADLLEEAGKKEVYSLEGGMKAWSEHLRPVKIGDLENGGAIYQFVRLGKGCLSYLVESNGEAAMIDANRMIDQYENFIEENHLTLKHVLDTHLHADHISGGRKLAEKAGAEYYLPPKDAGEVTYEYNQIQDGDVIQVGNTTIKAVYTPGHTIGSTSYIVDDNYLLTGDILFIDSIGRPDLAGKAEDWVADLRETLYKRYKELADDMIVLPAHFMIMEELNEDGSVAEKLGILYKQNHGLNIDDDNVFRKTVTENLPPQPNAYKEIRQTNMGKMTPDEEKQREMEIGPNRCAVK